MPTGYVKAIIENGGYGFIKIPDGDLFFHIRDSEFSDDDFTTSLVELRVSFEHGTDPISGRPRAVNVRVDK